MSVSVAFPLGNRGTNRESVFASAGRPRINFDVASMVAVALGFDRRKLAATERRFARDRATESQTENARGVDATPGVVA